MTQVEAIINGPGSNGQLLDSVNSTDAQPKKECSDQSKTEIHEDEDDDEDDGPVDPSGVGLSNEFHPESSPSALPHSVDYVCVCVYEANSLPVSSVNN